MKFCVPDKYLQPTVNKSKSANLISLKDFFIRGLFAPKILESISQRAKIDPKRESILPAKQSWCHSTNHNGNTDASSKNESALPISQRAKS